MENESSKDNSSWFKPRGYIHFDLPVSKRKAEKIVTSPEEIKKHAFYPFISYEIKTKKIANKNILQKKDKKRKIQYASHIDSHIYKFYSGILDNKYEDIIKYQGISDSILAFRKNLKKSNIDFADEAFEKIVEKKNCVAITIDIEKFFDNLDHSLLKKAWCAILGVNCLPPDHYLVFKSLTRYSYVERDILYKEFGISKHNPRKRGRRKRVCNADEFRERVRGKGMIKINLEKKGIPQGSPISGLLSNIYMNKFDLTILKSIKEKGGYYFRYCDDILCIVSCKEEKEIEEIIAKEIAKINLEINRDKKKLSFFSLKNKEIQCDNPLQYLGLVFDGKRKLIRSTTLARFSKKMKSGVRNAKLAYQKRNLKRSEKDLHLHNIYKKKLYERYSHLGKTNFIRYGLKCARKMKSNAIKKQLKPLWKRLCEEIAK